MNKILWIVLALEILCITPIPYYQSTDFVCKPGQLNCLKKGWHTYASMFQQIMSEVKQSNRGKSIRRAQPTPPPYICPVNGWVNCMPILSPDGQRACSTDAMNWYKSNCPNFQGAAM